MSAISHRTIPRVPVACLGVAEKILRSVKICPAPATSVNHQTSTVAQRISVDLIQRQVAQQLFDASDSLMNSSCSASVSSYREHPTPKQCRHDPAKIVREWRDLAEQRCMLCLPRPEAKGQAVLVQEGMLWNGALHCPRMVHDWLQG